MNENKLDKSIIFNNNLLFYTILKMLVQIKLSDKKLLIMSELINSKKINKIISIEDFKKILLFNRDIVKKDTALYVKFESFLNTLKYYNHEMWIDLCDLGIDLLLIKDLIITESKTFVNKQLIRVKNKIKDKLSLEYDLSNLQVPYGMRVIVSLISDAITNELKNSEFILSNSNETIVNINKKIIYVREKYKINTNNMYSLIMEESINQSIKSDAGSSYEMRFNEMIVPFVDDIISHVHDKNIRSVEYDFIFNINGIKVGTSVKRTLRERYKQNFEDVSLLNVDYMLYVTLGIDLNEEKLNNILQRNRIYILVASEIYDMNDYLKNSPFVISSSDITREKLESIFTDK